jgi:hypothetical protein
MPGTRASAPAATYGSSSFADQSYVYIVPTSTGTLLAELCRLDSVPEAEMVAALRSLRPAYLARMDAQPLA